MIKRYELIIDAVDVMDDKSISMITSFFIGDC